MIAALQAGKMPKISATLAGPDQLVQGLRLRIAKLQKLPSASHRQKIEREIEQLELPLKIATGVAEGDEAPITKVQDEPAPDDPSAPAWRRTSTCLRNATPREPS